MFTATKTINVSGRIFKAGEKFQGLRPCQLADLVRCGHAREHQTTKGTPQAQPAANPATVEDSDDGTDLVSLGLRPKEIEILARHGVTTLQQLQALTIDDLEAMKGFGKKFAAEIFEAAQADDSTDDSESES